MKRHIVGLSLLVASILLGWFFFTLGTVWLLIYVLFGGPILMAAAAGLDKKTRSDDKPWSKRERRTGR